MDVKAELLATSFEAFVQKHRRTYKQGTDEYERRYALFQERAQRAARHNSNFDRLWTWDPGNQFADRTEAELAALRAWRGPKVGRSPASFLEQGVRSRNHAEDERADRGHECALPPEKSWANLTSTRRIRDQGNCGSCSALATAVVLASHHEIHHGWLRTFAPQEFVSCAQNPEACGGEGGCQGGFMELLMAYALRHGLREEHEYPYTSHAGRTGFCKTRTVDNVLVGTQPGIYGAASSAPSTSFGMVGYERLPVNRYEPVMRALVERGPLTVALAAKNWHWYAGGIFDGCEKDPVIDHAVVLLGFGKNARSGHRFWHLHNSWGPGWGEGGRLRLLRLQGEEERCGQDREPQLGAACAKNKDGSRKSLPLEPVEVCGSCGILFNAVVPHFAGESPESLRLAAIRRDCEPHMTTA